MLKTSKTIAVQTKVLQPTIDTDRFPRENPKRIQYPNRRR
jgi:hypothetical protein